MEIKAESRSDKFYTHLSRHWGWYPVGLLITGLLYGAIYSDMKNTERFIAQKNKNIKDYKAKVSDILKEKQNIVCGEKKTYLTPNQYDITNIKGIDYVVTQNSLNDPLNALKLSNCEIITKKTSTMEIIKPKIIPIDEQHQSQVKKLNNQILDLQSSVSKYNNQQSAYVNTLDKAKTQISNLKTLVSNQEKEMKRLLIVEAQYKEVKTLLTIVLDKKDIRLKDLVVTEVKPKLSSIKVKKILKNINKDTLVVKTEIIPLENIADSKEYIKRQMYTIREIPQMHKQKEDSETLNHIMRRPSLKELDDITITEAQLKDIEHVKSQLNIAIKGMIKIYATRFDIDVVTFRNNIKLNVGI